MLALHAMGEGLEEIIHGLAHAGFVWWRYTKVRRCEEGNRLAFGEYCGATEVPEEKGVLSW